MKRVRLLVVLGALALALPFGLTAAHATGGSGGSTTHKNSVTIDPYADFDFAGTNVDVKLYVRCTGTAVANVTLQQSPPETASPLTVGSGPQPLVVCDGQTHSVGVTVVGLGFDTGYAKATATVTGATTASRTVYIRQ